MPEILTQSEIEAVLASIGGESAPEPDPARASSASPAARLSNRPQVSYEVYDFRRPDKFSKDQLRTLQMLHETFARLAGTSLSAMLRTPVNIDLISLEQVPYEEYLRSISQSVFTIMSLPPLTGQAVLELEFALVFTMIDRLLGGPGRTINRTNLTDIEKPLVKTGIERMFQALKNAWEGIVIVNPGIEGLETSSQFVQIAPPNDIVVTILFEVKIGHQRNAMSLCIPYLVLKPITAKLSAQKWVSNANRKHSPSARRMIGTQVSMADVNCKIRLGSTTLSFEEMVNLKEGDFLKLTRKSTDELELLVGDVPKFYGRPAISGRKLVFAVTDPIEE
ncbi:MAG TPA: flagellar motor switch protein FliM [Fimbriimonas sp.]|nr:flagellar motor switch protein FliM [Fimbriimonas sp.]